MNIQIDEIEREPSILIVDDEELNRELLNSALGSRGYSVVSCADGESALEALQENKPYLVLLDVMLPGIDGFEVCRQIKSNPELKDIPVLLLTALNSRNDRIKGVESGADDFISKPFDFQELLLRVRNAVSMHRLYQELADSYERLNELETFRNDMTQMMVHDLRSPLGGAIVLLAMLRKQIEAKLSDREVSIVRRVENSTRIVVEMMNSILDVERLKDNRIELANAKVDVNRIAADALEIMGTADQDIEVRLVAKTDGFQIECDEDLVKRVIINLVDNAMRHSAQNSAIEVRISSRQKGALIEIIDSGNGISPSILPYIFDKHVSKPQAKVAGHYSKGLGLAFCKLAVEAHNGEIGVQSVENQGSTFWFWLPGTYAVDQAA